MAKRKKQIKLSHTAVDTVAVASGRVSSLQAQFVRLGGNLKCPDMDTTRDPRQIEGLDDVFNDLDKRAKDYYHEQAEIDRFTVHARSARTKRSCKGAPKGKLVIRECRTKRPSLLKGTMTSRNQGLIKRDA